jgi:D-serine deaminase-like pyridoxal phosphate-dependent protein
MEFLHRYEIHVTVSADPRLLAVLAALNPDPAKIQAVIDAMKAADDRAQAAKDTTDAAARGDAPPQAT